MRVLFLTAPPALPPEALLRLIVPAPLQAQPVHEVSSDRINVISTHLSLIISDK